MKCDWSKSYLIKPRDHLQSHVFIKAKKFRPSYENDECPSPMSWLIGWEYSRIWLRERDTYIAAREMKSKPKRIKNDFTWWLVKRAPRSRRIC